MSEAITGIYTGPTEPDKHARPISHIESATSRIFNYDQHLTDVARSVPDGSVVTVLDLGSGSGGFLLSLSDPKEVPRFISSLRKKNLRLRAVGLTDSPEPQKFNRRDLGFVTRQALVPRLRTPQAVDNYFYTLTGSQDLENFLVDKNIDSLQFVNCSQSLMYLSAEVFATTLNQLLNRLAPSGEIFVWGVGKMTGPLPAFTWVRAEALRGEKRSQDVRDLNLFAPDNNVAVEVPLLTVRPDWPELKHRLDQLLLRLHDFNTVTPKDEAILVAAYFSQYQRFKLEARNNWSALATVADAAAMEALHYRVRLHGVIEEMKNRQYQKQVPAKQAYLKELQQRSDLSFKTLRTTEDGLIDTFVITNQARRESAASYLKSALPVPEKP